MTRMSRVDAVKVHPIVSACGGGADSSPPHQAGQRTQQYRRRRLYMQERLQVKRHFVCVCTFDFESYIMTGQQRY
jgi:hypothetical protein